MSYIFNQLVKNRIIQFNNCKPLGSGKWDIKPGGVYIQEPHPTPIGINGETIFCDANWRPHNYDPFFEGQTFRMNTDVLYNKFSTSSKKELAPQQLVHRLVHINSPAISYYLDQNGKSIAKYNVKWEIINKDIKNDIVTPKTAGIYTLVHTGAKKAKTLGEAMENFYAQSDENVRMAAYYEGYQADNEQSWHQPQEDEYFDDYNEDTLNGGICNGIESSN